MVEIITYVGNDTYKYVVITTHVRGCNIYVLFSRYIQTCIICIGNYWHVETYGYWDVYGCLDLLSAGLFALPDGFSVAGNGLIASIYSRFAITIGFFEHLCTTAK